MSHDGDKRSACTLCRRRKTRCDKKEPQCSFCHKNGLHCEYITTYKQPGLRAGYVSQLEDRLVAVEDRLSKVESDLAGSGATLDGHLRPSTGLNGAELNHHADMSDRDGGTVQQSPRHEIAQPAMSHHDEFEIITHAGQASPEFVSAAHQNGSTTSSYNTASGALPAFGFHVSPSAHITDNQFGGQEFLLPNELCTELCAIWFHKYHHWFPILHRPSWEQALLSPESLRHSDRWIVTEAIAVVTSQHSTSFDSRLRRQNVVTNQLTSSIILTAMNQPTIHSLQALLILSLSSYGDGKVSQSWNLFAMCRRIGTILGLPSLVRRQGNPTETSPPGPLRLELSSTPTVQQEEKIRAYWMTEMLDSISSVGASYETQLLTPPLDPVMPCSDLIWGFDKDTISEYLIRPSHHPSAFSLCIILAVNELSKVHKFQQQPVAMHDFEQRDDWQSEAQRIDEKLSMWRDEFIAAVFRLINAEYGQIRSGEMDPYIVLTNCVLNSAVITLLQRRTPCPQGVEQDVDPWAFATSRCVYACENTAFKVRQMHEDELLTCHPHLVFSIFVAARFYLVHSKALDANVPINLHSLAFALHTCSERWPLARRCETALRIAVAEYRTPVADCKVPAQFYDLKYSTLDLLVILQDWADSQPTEAG